MRTVERRPVPGIDRSTQPAVARDTVVVMVTHDGEPFLGAQMESIVRQTLRPAAIIVIDDDSHDRTRPILRDLARSSPIPVEVIEVDRSHVADIRTRVAANVMAGLEAASGFDIAILADQDDEWLEDRVAAQRHLLTSIPGALLVAGDASLMDRDGVATGGTLRQLFPAPANWSGMDPAARMHAALRRPLVAGAAAAQVTELTRLMSPIPPGWLHDRWATLVAAARGGLVLQPAPVIRYRVHSGQVLGVRDARAGAREQRWRQVLRRGMSPMGAAARAGHIVRRIRPLAVDPAIRSELSLRAILGSALDRV
jgi:glycosyltransferase involved in cell wall biosynthesis